MRTVIPTNATCVNTVYSLLWHHVTLLSEVTEIRYTVLLRTNLICLYGHMYFYHKVPVVYIRNMCAELQISLMIMGASRCTAHPQ